MSFPSSRWFHQGTDPGTIISLDKPIPSQWKILEKLNEHDFQAGEEIRQYPRVRSYAAAKFLCYDPRNPSRKAFLRVYLQVPIKNTEMQDPKTRSRQATNYTPPELTAYQTFTQKGFSNVPKLLGYKVSTQNEPGLRLGIDKLTDNYWSLSAVERERVRTAFKEALPQELEKGHEPYVPGLPYLVWHSQTGNLCFIGYFYGKKAERKDLRNIEIGPVFLAMYGLAKPSSDEWGEDDWNGDTTGWKW
ncbi:hypothetical protein PEBR_35717 [Penicillium brasilianum]|uniref:Uncharacterized protein n=1 Tax=Penicillium brasilianum TaxID=104259 RepID=A0A1S9RDK2_PENBI|nr:hypothetical protein PEBR_35717 [Penicillium brasilianum]